MKESEQNDKRPKDQAFAPCCLCAKDCRCKRSMKLGEKVANLSEIGSQESDDSRKRFTQRRLIANDPELVRLRKKRDAMIVQQVHVSQMAQVHKRISAEKEYDKMTDEEALVRLGEQINRSNHDQSSLLKSCMAGREALIGQMADKRQTQKDFHDAEVRSDRENIRIHIEQEDHRESKRREYEIAKRIQVREDYNRFIEERRIKLDNEAKGEADQISREIAYVRKVSDREEALARLKRMGEIERSRITSVITQRVDDDANRKTKHGELLNLLHMERIDIRDKQLIQKKERDKLNERHRLLEEYRRHKNNENSLVLERKRESEQTRNHENSEFKKYETSQADLKIQRRISQRALHDDLDSVLVEQRREFTRGTDLQSRGDIDGELIRKLENELLEEEKAQILDDIRKLSVHM